MESDGYDVGFMDDAIDLIENMTAAENHAVRTFFKTKDVMWLEALTMVRRDRSRMLYKLVPEEMGEAYCFSKHISNAIMNYKELGNRMIEQNDDEGAMEFFEKATIYENLLKIISQKGGKDESKQTAKLKKST